MDYFTKLDNIINIACTNIFTLSKKEKKLVFYGLDTKNESHLGFYSILLSFKNILNINVELEMPFWKYFWFKRKHKGIPRYKSKEGTFETYFMDVEQFIRDIEDANDGEDLFRKIYITYFKR